MKLFGIWTLFVALCISAVAAYYSIVGLTAIFAAAVVPVIIMATVLEIGKINTAVLLHLNWRKLPVLTKTYLTFATAVLMFITSMGIFGFLSSAHIEQTAVGQEQTAVIARIEQDISQAETRIDRNRNEISRLRDGSGSQFQSLQDRIEQAQEQIDRSFVQIEPDIEQQERIIEAREKALASRVTRLENEIAETREAEQALDDEIAELVSRNFITRSREVRVEQQPQRDRLSERRSEIREQIAQAQSGQDSVIVQAREEISRLRAQAREDAQSAEATVRSLRERQANDDEDSQIATRIAEIEASTQTVQQEIRDLEDRKFALETQTRQLEAEVGPVRYIAEFVYGDSDQSTIENAVRWVIIILVIVFDPFAIVLVISGVWMITQNKKPKNNILANMSTENREKLREEMYNADRTSPRKTFQQSEINKQDAQLDSEIEETDEEIKKKE